MLRANNDIRELIERKRIRYWEVASRLGISPETFCRSLRHELSPEKKKAVIEALYRTDADIIGGNETE